MNNFNKVGIAAAVATALGSFGSAQALTLGQPGEALLVPFAICDQDNAVDTLVGITVPGWLGNDPTRLGQALGGAGAFSTAPATSGGPGGMGAGLLGGIDDIGKLTDRIHWHFFSVTSGHLLDDEMPATKDDYVPFDWCSWVTGLNRLDLMGVPGYLVFRDSNADSSAGASFGMFGDAAIVQGNWQSAGWIPVVPMADSSGNAVSACVNELQYAGEIPKAFPLCAGIARDNDDGVADDVQTVNLRYFLDPAFGGATQMVLWFDHNCRADVPTDGCTRNLPVLVFDNEEDPSSDQLGLPHELNIIDVGNYYGEGNPLANTLHAVDETFRDEDINVTLVNEGFVQIPIPEISNTGHPQVDMMTPPGPQSAMVAFSFIQFGTSENSRQVQTALGQELGLDDGM